MLKDGDNMAKITKINHIAIVVPDIDGSLSFWRDALGLELHHLDDVPSEKVVVAFLPVGDSEVELIKPATDDSGVARFLIEKGAGMHHLCLEVDDLDVMVADLKSKGVRLLGDAPKELPGRKMIFIHPKAAGGVLVELYQLMG
jgi:methylmalonyl-CoA/ethylmalonyl-CoA epimerase